MATSSNLGNGNFTLTNLGTDPNCSANTVYKVTYTWQYIADSNFPGNIVECSFTIYNNCSITNYNTIVGYTTGVTYTNASDVFSHPCDRTDQAFINPPSNNQTYANVAGAYVTCNPPSGYTWTTKHQVEYRAVTNSSDLSWGAQSSGVHGGVVPGTSSEIRTLNACCDVLNFLSMTLHSGAWLVRYRNVYGLTCQEITSFNGDWGTNYVTEYWLLN